jgi:hypothetical protein
LSQIDNTQPHLFYTNVKTIQHNKYIFEKTNGQTFIFLAQDSHSNTCPSHFKWPMIPSQTTKSNFELFLKKNMLVKLCGRNFVTSCMAS